MKSICFVLVLLFTKSVISQDEKEFDYMKKIPVGMTYSDNGISIKFVKVLTDSRCPKDVTCVRAGEAKILVAIYENQTFVQEKELVIDASGFVSDFNNLAFSSKAFSIFALGLYPYPTASSPIPFKDYVLEFGTTNNL